MSLTWFKLPIADFMKETRRLSLEARGAYVTLLADYYENGPFADCAVALSNVAGVQSSRMADIWEELEPLFIRDLQEGEWHHLRADKEIADRSKASERAVTNGSKGGRKPTSSIMEKMRREVEQREPLVIDEEAVRQMVAEDQKRAPKPLAFVVDGETDGDDAPDLTSAPKVETTTQYIGKPPPDLAQGMPNIEPDEDEDEDEPFTSLSPDFKLDPAEISQCRADGATFDQIAAWFDEWKTKHIQAGSTAQDWKAAWDARFAARLKSASRSRPRVEVSRKA